MTYIQIPLWIAIFVTVILGFMTLHLIVGDMLAKIFYKKIREEEEKKKESGD